MTAPADQRVAYSVREASYLCDVSVEEIRAAINSGELRAVHPRINGKPRRSHTILRADLLAWLEGGST